MIYFQINEGAKLEFDFTCHVCPFCSNTWFEASDRDFYPDFCPGCGMEYDVNQEPMEPMK